MNLTHEYMHHRTGYGLGAGCWIRVYKGAPGDAPVVICEALPGSGGVLTKEAAGYLAAEVIRDHFPDGLPDLERPVLWIEHRPALRRGPANFSLPPFPPSAPRRGGAGFVPRAPLAPPRREPLDPAEVATLT